MDKLLLGPEGILEALGFESHERNDYTPLTELGVPLIYPLGPNHPRIRPVDLQGWLADRLPKYGSGVE